MAMVCTRAIAANQHLQSTRMNTGGRIGNLKLLRMVQEGVATEDGYLERR